MSRYDIEEFFGAVFGLTLGFIFIFSSIGGGLYLARNMAHFLFPCEVRK